MSSNHQEMVGGQGVPMGEQVDDQYEYHNSAERPSLPPEKE